MIIFVSISLIIHFRCSKEPSHLDSSFEYPQHMIWLINKKNKIYLHTFIWGPVFINASTCHDGHRQDS